MCIFVKGSLYPHVYFDMRWYLRDNLLVYHSPKIHSPCIYRQESGTGPRLLEQLGNRLTTIESENKIFQIRLIEISNLKAMCSLLLPQSQARFA